MHQKSLTGTTETALAVFT